MAYSIVKDEIFRDDKRIGILAGYQDVDYDNDGERYHPHVVKMLKREGRWDAPVQEVELVAPAMVKEEVNELPDADSGADDSAAAHEDVEEQNSAVFSEPAAAETEEGNKVQEPQKKMTVRELMAAMEKLTDTPAPEWKHWLGGHNPELIEWFKANDEARRTVLGK